MHYMISAVEYTALWCFNYVNLCWSSDSSLTGCLSLQPTAHSTSSAWSCPCRSRLWAFSQSGPVNTWLQQVSNQYPVVWLESANNMCLLQAYGVNLNSWDSVQKHIFFLYLLVCRCVCAAAGLRLPAVPEGPANQAGVPDSVLPGSLCGCRGGFSLRHLSHIHRLVHSGPRSPSLVTCS